MLFNTTVSTGSISFSQPIFRSIGAPVVDVAAGIFFDDTGDGIVDRLDSHSVLALTLDARLLVLDENLEMISQSFNLSDARNTLGLVAGTTSSVALGDYNNDGSLDVAVSESTFRDVIILRNQSLRHFANPAGDAFPILSQLGQAQSRASRNPIHNVRASSGFPHASIEGEILERNRVSITISPTTVVECVGVFFLRLFRTGDLTAELEVSLSVGGTATMGADYAAFPATVVIPAGENQTNLAIAVLDDDLLEATETLVVRILDSSAYEVDAMRSDATGNIFECDSAIDTTFRSNIVTLDFDRDGDLDFLIASQTGQTSGEIVAVKTVHVGHGYFVSLLAIDESFADANFGSNPRKIVLTGSEETVVLCDLSDDLISAIESIDVRGTGNNSVILDATKLAELRPNESIQIVSNSGDRITFGEGWTFAGVESVNGQLQRVFQNGGAIVRVIGPRDFTNPFIAGDVNGSGDVTAGDALDIIFSLSQPQLFDSQGMLVDATTVAPSSFRFYDPNEDGMSTAADALFVINVLFIQSLGVSGEGETLGQPTDLIQNPDSKAEHHSMPIDESTFSTIKVGRIHPAQSSASLINSSVLIDSVTDKRDNDIDRESDLDATLATVWNWIDLR